MQNISIKTIGQPTDWLAFWGVYISSIASFIMAFIAWKTLLQNNKQLKIINEQFEMSINAELAADVVFRDDFYMLRIRNCGNADAYDVSVKISNFEIQSYNDLDNRFLKINGYTFFVPKSEERLFPIVNSFCSEKLINYEFLIVGHYKTANGKPKEFSTKIRMSDYIGVLYVPSSFKSEKDMFIQKINKLTPSYNVTETTQAFLYLRKILHLLESYIEKISKNSSDSQSEIQTDGLE